MTLDLSSEVMKVIARTTRISLHLASQGGTRFAVNISATSTAFSDLAIVLRDLKVGVGAWCAQGLLPQALAMMLYRHLCAVTCRMERLVARFEAGLPLVRPRVLLAYRVEVVASDVREPRPVVARIWPNQFAWLIRRAAWRAACFGGQLRTVLARPEMIALLAASPQAVRILSPLCRMLAIEPFVFRLAVEAKPVATPKKRAKRVRVPIDFGRIPLPRGVLTAARLRGFKPR